MKVQATWKILEMGITENGKTENENSPTLLNGTSFVSQMACGVKKNPLNCLHQHSFKCA